MRNTARESRARSFSVGNSGILEVRGEKRTSVLRSGLVGVHDSP